MQVKVRGSLLRKITVDLQGLPVMGLIDSGADITIMNGDVFKKVAAIAWVKKKAFKATNKTPYGYDNKPFTLNGQIDLDITFVECTMRTTIYLKMDFMTHYCHYFVINWALSHSIQMLVLTCQE